MNKRMSVIKYVSINFVNMLLSLQLMKMYLCFYVYTSMQLYMFRGVCLSLIENVYFILFKSMFVTQSKSFLSFFLSFSNILE